MLQFTPLTNTHNPPSAGVGIGRELRSWFLEWLSALDRVLDKKLSNHQVCSKVAALENAYRFAEFGYVLAAAAAPAAAAAH